jgi:hypothetical protein
MNRFAAFGFGFLLTFMSGLAAPSLKAGTATVHP